MKPSFGSHQEKVHSPRMSDFAQRHDLLNSRRFTASGLLTRQRKGLQWVGCRLSQPAVNRLLTVWWSLRLDRPTGRSWVHTAGPNRQPSSIFIGPRIILIHHCRADLAQIRPDGLSPGGQLAHGTALQIRFLSSHGCHVAVFYARGNSPQRRFR
jgi:hypothetical protein